MNDTVLGSIVGAVATITGGVIGYLGSHAQARAARRGELRSLLEAVRWEVLDAKDRALADSGLPIPLPTVELIVQRGMLADLPTGLRQRFLQVRSLVAAYNDAFTALYDAVKANGVTLAQTKELLAREREMGAKLSPRLATLAAALEEHMIRLVATRWRRCWTWLLRRECPSVTPRSL